MGEEEKPPLDVSHPSIQFVLSDISCTPNASPAASRTSPCSKSIDAKLKRKWKRQIERERVHARARAAKANEQSKDNSKDTSNSSSFIELTKDLLVPCVQDSSCSAPELEELESPNEYGAPTKLADLSDSLEEPPVEPPVVTPDEKESHKVLAKLDTSGDKNGYAPQEQEFHKFHEQLYAPQEQEYVSFLRDLENAKGDPSAEDFAKWLKGMDKDIQPIAPQTSPDTPENMKGPEKKVAFSKETTVRFFSRTREELAQLRRTYKKTIGGGDVIEDESDEDDWPFFKYLDDKLKDMEESNAWDDPMSAVTDMFVSKEVKEKISPIICVCEHPTNNVDSSNVTTRSLADSDDDDDDEDDLGPAMALAATKAAAALTQGKEAKEQSMESHKSTESASGISALWFAVPYKSSNDESTQKGDSFVRPAPSPSSSKSSSPDKASACSSPRITIEAPKSLSLIQESARSRSGDPIEEPPTIRKLVSAVAEDPDAPKPESLSWLAEDLDDSREGGIALLSDPRNDSSLSIDKSLGRNTNSSLLRRVSEHLNISDISGGTASSSSVDQDESGAIPKERSFLSTSSSSTKDLKTATALKKLFEPLGDHSRDLSDSRESETKTITVSVAELDALVKSKEKNTSLLSSDPKDTSADAMNNSNEPAPSSEGCDSSSSRETPFDQKKHVVNAAKRWVASQKSGVSHRSGSATSPSSIAQRKKQVETVKAAKRWAASQKAKTRTMTVLSPTPEDGPDLDEYRHWDEKPVNTSADFSDAVFSETTDVWDGVKDTPRKDKATEEEIAFDFESKDQDVAAVDSDPWLEPEDGPDLDESKEWNTFACHPDMTTTTGSVSHDSPRSEEADDDGWVAFTVDGVKNDSLMNESWSAAFTEDEKPTSTADKRPQSNTPSPPRSPRKQVRASPTKSAPSTRVQQIAREFERRHGLQLPPEEVKEDWDVSPLTPSTPWVEADRQKDARTAVEFPDLQQPVLDDSLSDSNQKGSPVSVTHM